MVNKKAFYSNARRQSLFNTLTQPQVSSIETILDYWDASKLPDIRWLAYMLATVYHETSRTMQPIAEFGKGKGHSYGHKIKMSGIAYEFPDQIYYGRGYVQLTWYENYELMGRLLKIDLLNNPELALVPMHAVRIMFEGMTKGNSSFGDFTGKCLEMYINGATCDYKKARFIINGRDKADTIADYAKRFEWSLTN